MKILEYESGAIRQIPPVKRHSVRDANGRFVKVEKQQGPQKGPKSIKLGAGSQSSAQ